MCKTTACPVVSVPDPVVDPNLGYENVIYKPTDSLDRNYDFTGGFTEYAVSLPFYKTIAELDTSVDRTVLIDGVINNGTEEPFVVTVFTEKNETGLKVTLMARDKVEYVALTSDFNTELLVNKSTQVSTGEPFILNVAWNKATKVFEVKVNDEDVLTTDPLGADFTKDFTLLSIEGAAKVNFVGIVPQSTRATQNLGSLQFKHTFAALQITTTPCELMRSSRTDAPGNLYSMINNT